MNLEKILDRKELEPGRETSTESYVETHFAEYKGHQLRYEEYEAITEIEELLGEEPEIPIKPFGYPFELSIEDNHITYLRISFKELEEIPKQINSFSNLQKLHFRLYNVSKIENLPPNLKILVILCNIKKIENLDHLSNLQELYLQGNKVSKIENLPLTLKNLSLHGNKIKKIENLPPNLQYLDIGYNQISKIENIDHLSNLQEIELCGNQIENRQPLEKLRKRKVMVRIERF